MEETYGPPVVLLFGLPVGIAYDELVDMVSDGAPVATQRGDLVIRVVDRAAADRGFLDWEVQRALQECYDNNSDSVDSDATSTPLELPCPVVYCSGLANQEMMDAYNIIAREIYAETDGAMRAACAKAVAPAMQKTVRQVIGEITGDHMDAINVWT